MTVLRWLGQSCFILTTVHGLAILIDPPHPEVGYAISAHSIPAQVVFVSHQHFDHNFVEAAVSPSVVIQGTKDAVPGRFDTVTMTGSSVRARNSMPRNGYADGELITSGGEHIPYRRIFAYHDNQQGTLRGPDVMTTWTVDGLHVAHLGDLGQDSLTPAQVAAIGPVDVLMIPAGGYFTLEPNLAAGVVDQLHPRVIIPMHYQTPAVEPQLRDLLEPVDNFLAAMQGKADIVHLNSSTLDLSPSTLPDRPTVYVMRYE